MSRLDESAGICDASTMTKVARQFIETFDALPEDEKRVVTVEILRRTALEDQASLEEAELVLAADQVFLDLDRREEQD